MLHPDHRYTELRPGTPDHVDRARELGVVEAGHHLVEQHEAGPAGELASELEESLLVEVQAADGLVAPIGKTDEVEHVGRSAHGLLLAPTRPAEQCTERRVLPDGHRLEGPRCLQHHGHAGVADPVSPGAGQVGASEDDGAPARRLHAADRLQQRRLAGAVRADEGDDLALVDRERHTGNCGESAEALLDVGQFEDRHGTLLLGQPVDGSYGVRGFGSSSVSGYQSPASLTPSGAGPSPAIENSGCAAAISPHSVQLSGNG